MECIVKYLQKIIILITKRIQATVQNNRWPSRELRSDTSTNLKKKSFNAKIINSNFKAQLLVKNLLLSSYTEYI